MHVHIQAHVDTYAPRHISRTAFADSISTCAKTSLQSRKRERRAIYRANASPARRSVACRRSSPQRRSRLSHGEITLFTHAKTTSRYDHSILIENAVRRERAVPLNRASGIGGFSDGFKDGARAAEKVNISYKCRSPVAPSTASRRVIFPRNPRADWLKSSTADCS